MPGLMDRFATCHKQTKHNDYCYYLSIIMYIKDNI